MGHVETIEAKAAEDRDDWADPKKTKSKIRHNPANNQSNLKADISVQYKVKKRLVRKRATIREAAEPIDAGIIGSDDVTDTMDNSTDTSQYREVIGGLGLCSLALMIGLGLWFIVTWNPIAGLSSAASGLVLLLAIALAEIEISKNAA